MAHRRVKTSFRGKKPISKLSLIIHYVGLNNIPGRGYTKGVIGGTPWLRDESPLIYQGGPRIESKDLFQFAIDLLHGQHCTNHIPSSCLSFYKHIMWLVTSHYSYATQSWEEH